MKSRFAYSILTLALMPHLVFAVAPNAQESKPEQESASTAQADIQTNTQAEAQASTQAETKAPERIVVRGRAMQMYVDKETEIGTKTAINVMELPQSVQVLTEQLIDDQAARNITDLYRSIAGVSEFSYSGVTFRGFRDDANVFYDGVRGDPYSGFSQGEIANTF